MAVMSVYPILQNEHKLAACVGLSAALLAVGILLFPAASRAQIVTTTIQVGTGPQAVAINAVTNQIYVANSGSGNVTVIDGATNTVTKVGVGTQPQAIAVNPLTNTIYVANYGSANVTVINGATNKTTTVGVGTNPYAIAVNPETNTVYVANAGSANVTVINGATNKTTTAGVGTKPYAVAVNPITNMVYVANYGSANVTVINGATNTANATPVAAGTQPYAVAVNPVTNQVYVTNYGSENVTVIDGATNTPSTVAAGASPCAVAVNPVANQTYVANCGSPGSASTATVINGTSTVTSTITVGMQPQAIAVNPITNEIYVANYGGGESSTVTVINGATGSTTPFTAGSAPWAVAVNPVTDKIYVANQSSNNVTVLDGATNAVTSSTEEADVRALALELVTNQVYAVDPSADTVTVIDGATNETTTTVATGSAPNAIAADPVTNTIYVADCGSTCYGTGNGGVTIIDGATNAPVTLAVGTNPIAVAVNPVTNKIYFANNGSANVTVMDGATEETTMVPVAANPQSVAVNPVTNKIYVSSYSGGNGNVTVIDGATLATTTVTGVSGPLAVNPVTNKIYLTCSCGLTAIDGVTLATSTVPLATNSLGLAVNPMTNMVYVAYGDGIAVIDGATSTVVTSIAGIAAGGPIAVNAATNKIYAANGTDSLPILVIDGATNTAISIAGGGNYEVAAVANPVTNTIYATLPGSVMTVLTEAPAAQQAVSVVIQPLEGNTSGALPTFQMQAQDVNGNPLQPTALYWQMDTMQGQWLPATAASGTGNFTAAPAAPLLAGMHVLYAYAVEGDAGDPDLDMGGPRIGTIAAYPFIVTAYTQVWLTTNLDTQTYGQPLTFTADIIPHPGGGATPTGTVTFYDGINFLGTETVSSSGSATLTTSALVAGQHSISASYSGDEANAASSGGLYVPLTISQATLTVTANSLSMAYGGTFPTLTYTITGFENGDTQESATTGTPQLSTTASGGSAPGVYPITITAGSLAAANYSFAFVDGSLTVTKAQQTITFAALPSMTYGAAPFTVSATASSGLPVSFASTTPSVCTVSGATVTLVSGEADCSIQATQAGNSDYNAAPAKTQSFWVYRETQTITFPGILNQTYGATLTLSATASSGLPVSFASTTSAVCTVSGTTATMVSVGTCTIQATQAGNTDYGAATAVSRTFTVTKASQTITFAALPSMTYGAAPFTVSATASSGLPVSFVSTTTSVCTVSGSTVTLVSAGANCTLEATQAGNSDYSAAPATTRTFWVDKEAQTITFPGILNQTYGATLTLSATASSGLPVSWCFQRTASDDR